VVGVIVYVLASLVNLGVQSLMEEAPRNPQLDLIAPDGFSWSGLLITLVFVGAIVPFAEELFFRGLVFGWLRRRMPVWLAASVSGLGFAVLHGVWWLIPALALLGIVLALIYERSGTIWTAVITHGLFNSFTTLLYFLALATGLELPA
jgi:membrane protease YdiL (CAAX protease family)